MKYSVYENIRKIRELKNFTREYVAAELKMSTSGYGKIERGDVDLTVSKLIEISKQIAEHAADMVKEERASANMFEIN